MRRLTLIVAVIASVVIAIIVFGRSDDPDERPAAAAPPVAARPRRDAVTGISSTVGFSIRDTRNVRKPAGVFARVLHDREELPVLGDAAPAGRVDEETLAQERRARTQRDRHRGEKFVERALRRRGERRVADHPRLRHEERAQLGVVETGYARAPFLVELPPAPRAAQRKHRHARRAQRLEIAHRRPLRHLETLRDLTHGHLSVRLKQEQRREQSVGSHDHYALAIV